MMSSVHADIHHLCLVAMWTIVIKNGLGQPSTRCGIRRPPPAAPLTSASGERVLKNIMGAPAGGVLPMQPNLALDLSVYAG
jgi:hypothetical protein